MIDYAEDRARARSLPGRRLSPRMRARAEGRIGAVWVNSLRLMSEEEESLRLGLSSYPLEVRFGSFKIIPDQKLLSLEDNHRKIVFCRMCRLEVATIEIHEQYCDLSIAKSQHCSWASTMGRTGTWWWIGGDWRGMKESFLAHHKVRARHP